MKNIILLLVGSCFLFSDTFSQEVEWQNTIGGSSTEFLNSIKQTSDGGYILGGYSSSNISGDKTENCWGYDDYWLVKTDSSGNIQWENTIGGSKYDYLYSVEQTNDGGYILGGTSLSGVSGDKTESRMGISDYWILKTDAAGNIQWQNTIGGGGADYLFSIQQTSDGGYILGGQSTSNISGDKTENCIGADDYWIVKTDVLGNIEWENTIGGGNYDLLRSIQQTSDGGYIMGGRSNSNISGDKTEDNKGGSDYWIVKTDTSGNIQWQNTIGGDNYDELRSLQQTSDGGYILGGYSKSSISGDKTENKIGYEDYWIIKTDTSGNIQWQNTIGGSASDVLNSIQQTNDGGYILGGMSVSSISGDKTQNSNGSWDYWIIKTDASGNIQWQNTIGGSNDDEPFSIRQTNDNGYILGGVSQSDFSADKIENSNGATDYWIVKLTDKFNSITGKLFIDANSNGLEDAGELALNNKTVTEISSGRFCFSEQNGNYSASLLDSGNFSVYPAPMNYYNPVPANHTAYFSGIQQIDSLNDFAFQPAAGSFNDLCVTITPLGNFRAGMNASYMINYENVGTTILNGTVIFFPDNDVTFASSNVTPTSVTTDSVVWNVGTLTPFQTGSILVTVNVNMGTPIGTLINSSVIIEPVAGDANPVCNYHAWEVFVTGSFDPNAILVDRDTVFTTELSSPPYLNYIIYFQNTGNDTAFNARVLNNIPDKLDISSFEFVASSHPMNITYGAHARLMTFTFDNILLPDSNVNEPASHGFVRYRIKPLSTLVAGDSIKNNAAIYFDFNLPVMTNTAVTEIVLPTNLTPGPSPEERGVALAPNPATNTLTIKFPQLTTDHCQLITYDLFGREVYKSEINNPKSEIRIDVSGLAKGIYLIEINSAGKIYRAKFVKE